MDLFEKENEEHGLSAEAFAKEFARLAKELDLSSKSSTKNVPLEKLVGQHTGWPVSVKGASKENLIGNRFDEAKGKSNGTARHLVLLTPEQSNRSAQANAKREVIAGNWDVVALSIHDRDPPTITHIIHAKNLRLPRILIEAFPGAQISSIVPVAGAAGTSPSTPAVARSVKANYSVSSCAAETGLAESRLLQWLEMLKRKKQIVFQGPPGSGKTFIAKRIAQLLVSGSTGQVEMVQFHPSMTYEDFVQGLRPSIKEGQVHYSIEAGRFMQVCIDARNEPQAPHVLIIDEINRGNLSRIFGELLYLLEYRGESIKLAQGETPFSVPPNVYLIATMNTADRSIALVDHALRRRFSFVFLGPDYEHLSASLRKHGLHDGERLVDVLRAINQRIGDRHYHLGTSYFLTPGPSIRTLLPEIWQGEIEPHLDEYFFDQPEVAAEFSWAKLSTTTLSGWGASPSDPPAGAGAAHDAAG